MNDRGVQKRQYETELAENEIKSDEQMQRVKQMRLDCLRPVATRTMDREIKYS